MMALFNLAFIVVVKSINRVKNRILQEGKHVLTNSHLHYILRANIARKLKVNFIILGTARKLPSKLKKVLASIRFAEQLLH